MFKKNLNIALKHVIMNIYVFFFDRKVRALQDNCKLKIKFDKSI